MSKKMKVESFDYVLPTWALCALINGDDSGLESKDSETLNNFENDIISKHGAGHWGIPENIDSEKYFSWRNDIDGAIGGDVIECQYIVIS